MENALAAIASKLPILGRIQRKLAYVRERQRLSRMSGEAIFTEIYWKLYAGREPDRAQTRKLAGELPQLLRELNVQSVLDAGCGLFHWMRAVDFGAATYIGADIVQPVLEHNKALETDHIHFQRLDLLSDPLPAVDLVFCRDTLVHFSPADSLQALRNMRASGATYLLATTFPGGHPNPAIHTGSWAALNLQALPFSFPQPLRLINEGCTEGGPGAADKSLGLWRFPDLESALNAG